MLNMLLEKIEHYVALSTFSGFVMYLVEQIMRLHYLIPHLALVYHCCTHLDVCPAFAPLGYAGNLTHPCRLLGEGGPLI